MNNKKLVGKGFTLVEVMVAAAILGIITMSVLAALTSWQRSWNINEVQMDVQFEARRAMNRMAEELAQANSTNINISAANDVITFQLPNNDYASGNFTWGDQIQYSLTSGTNGINQLSRTNLATNQTEVIASYINNIQFTLTSDVLSMQLTVNKNLKGDNSQLQLNSRVSLRNL